MARIELFKQYKKRLKKAFSKVYIEIKLTVKVKLNDYLPIILYYNIAEYINIIEYILKSTKLSKKDGNCKKWEKKYK